MKMKFIAGVCVLMLSTATYVAAHCDTLNGPVVTDAKSALQKGDVTPVLKWIKSEYEPGVRAAFKKTLAVRTQGPEARELADTYFFETVVRLHRAGEGAQYDGLKPAETKLGPAVEGADRALESGSVESLVDLLTREAAQGIRERFEQASALKKRAGGSVEAGRHYVEAYIEFVHYVERLHRSVTSEMQEAHTQQHGHQ